MKICFWLFLALFAMTAAAQPHHSGYAIIVPMDVTARAADLRQPIIRRITQRNLYDGLRHILRGTGYRLARRANADPQIHRLYTQPYPERWRQIGPAPLDQVLTTLAGPAWQLVVDPVNRRLSFELKAQYRCGYPPAPRCTP